MASANAPEVVQCEPCLYNTVTVPAVVWCLSCEDGLCQTCADSHKGIKATRGHKVIPVEKCQTISSLKHLMSQQCREHNGTIDLYCPTHDTLGCRLCILNDHKECKNITSLDDISKNVVSSASFTSLENEITNLLSDLSLAKENRHENKEKLEKQKLLIQSTIKEMRKKLNTQLDTLETSLLANLSFSHKNCESRIEEFIEDLDAKLRNVSDTRKHISELKEIATNSQLFVAIRELQKKITAERNDFQKMIRENLANEQSLILDIEPLQKLIDITSFGSVTISSHPCKVNIADPEVKEAQVKVDPHDTNIQAISLVNKVDIKDIGTIYFNVFGCATCKNGNLIFARAFPNQLDIFYSTETRVRSIPVDQIPFDITSISENIIAVTQDGGTFVIADITNNELRIIKRVKTEGQCSGIYCEYNTLAVYIYQKRIYLYDLEGNCLKKIPQISCDELYCKVVMSDKKVYLSSVKDGAIRCFDLGGKEVWKLKFQLISNIIAIDKKGNVFVVSNHNKIIVISSDGSKTKELLHTGHPRSIHFDNANCRLLVRNAGTTATLFDVKY